MHCSAGSWLNTVVCARKDILGKTMANKYCGSHSTVVNPNNTAEKRNNVCVIIIIMIVFWWYLLHNQRYVDTFSMSFFATTFLSHFLFVVITSFTVVARLSTRFRWVSKKKKKIIRQNISGQVLNFIPKLFRWGEVRSWMLEPILTNFEQREHVWCIIIKLKVYAWVI